MFKLFTVFLIVAGALYAVGTYYTDVTGNLQQKVRSLTTGLPGFENPEELHKTLLESAQNNNVAAMVRLGIEYDKGTFGEKQSREAVKWLETARRWNSAEGAYFLGVILYEGRDRVRRNYRKAFEQFKFASERGIPQAFRRLGVMHENGQGTRKNPREALYSYSMASRLGMPTANSDAKRVGGLLSSNDASRVAGRVNRDLITLQNVRDSQLSSNLMEIIVTREGIDL